MSKFDEDTKSDIAEMGKDFELKKLSREWFDASSRHKYSYHFKWLGRPIIQFPQDILAMQELIWEIKPDLVIETGVAHGGSCIFYASMLELLGGQRRVIGIDVDIRQHNRVEIERHPLYKRITLLEGSSISQEIVHAVYEIARGCERVLVVLDSLHTHEHTLSEMKLYSPLIKNGSYLVVFDTVIEDLPEDLLVDRPWGKGNNPKTAVWEFLKTNNRFEIDQEIENKLLITVAPDGYLRCIKD